jgi:putative acetyltransferase
MRICRNFLSAALIRWLYGKFFTINTYAAESLGGIAESWCVQSSVMDLPMDDQVKIEPGQPEDAAAILEIHAAAVHQTAAPYYPEEVINSWSRPITSERIERVKQRWIENPDHRIVVAKQNNQTVGFGFIDKNNELQGLYVHPNFSRCGIGARIFAILEQEAILLGLSYLKLDASINAEAFYSKQGFKVIEYGIHRLASGQEMACVKMRKTLHRM